MCDRDLLDGIVDRVYNAHLAVHFAYGFDLLCLTLEQGMVSSILHFRVFGSSTSAQILVNCLYDPSNTLYKDFFNTIAGLEDSSFGGNIVVHFTYWASLVLGCDDLRPRHI